MNILRLKQFLLSRAAPTHWKDDSESIQLSAELMDVQMAAAPDFGSEESVGVGYSLEFFGFAQQPPTGSSESLNVGYSIDAFEFKRHPDLSSQESLGVGYAIEDFVFKEMPTIQSEESLGVGYSIEAFEFKRPSWTLDGDGMPLEAYALLMHMDGNAGGISLDHGFYARPVTRVSTAQLVTTDKQFGTASMQGVSLGGFSVPETATLQMRAGAFQCDWRMKITAVNAWNHVISNLNTAYGRPYEWSIGYLNDAIHFYYGTRGSNQAHIKLKLPGGVTFTSLLNQWVSVSLARNSNGKWGAWLNGVPTTQYQVSVLQGGVNYGAVTTGDYVNATDFGAGYTDEVIAVGAAIIPGHDNLNVSGLLDEVRYLVGTCREIGAAYTPMAVPFANASSGGE